MNSMSQKYSDCFVFLLFFLSLYYVKEPFRFGYDNNFEELPLIYKVLHIADYQNDPFVEAHFQRFTQVTPYIHLIKSVAHILGADHLPQIYLSFHFITIALLYCTLRYYYRLLCDGDDRLIFFLICGLVLFTKWLRVIPTKRWLFVWFMDPELLAYPLNFLAIAFYLGRKNFASACFLMLATVVHPLYSFFTFFSLLCCSAFEVFLQNASLKETIRNSALYSLATIPYTLYLYSCSRQTVFTGLDATLIAEIIRSPHHHEIPTLLNLPMLFYSFSICSLALTVMILKGLRIELSRDGLKLWLAHIKKSIKHGFQEKIISNFAFRAVPKGLNGDEEINRRWRCIIFINAILIVFLFASSIIASIGRIPILIQLTPYRMGVIIVSLSWIIITASFYHTSKKAPQMQIPRKMAIPLKVVTIVFSLVLFAYSCRIESGKEILPEQVEVISWIRENTPANDIFLNYSDIPIRTQCQRPDIFEYKTMPLFADAQIAWYRHYVIVNDVPQSISISDYEAVKKYVRNCPGVDAERVVSRLAPRPNYLIKCNRPVPDPSILKGRGFYQYYPVDTGSFSCVFKNNLYSVYDLG
jgi:hypothetical protein